MALIPYSGGAIDSQDGCKICAKRLGKRNTSGFCVTCFRVHVHIDPELVAKRKAGLRNSFSSPERRAAYSDRAKQKRIWEMVGPAGSPTRIAVGRKGSASKLAWCPVEYRDLYRKLRTSTHFGAGECKAMILDLVAVDQRRFDATGVLPQTGRAAA